MAEFLWVESESTQLEEQPRVASTQFGDGYAQEAADGLNPNPQAWRVAFRDVENSVADLIIAFLRARITSTAGLEPFDWTPLWSTTKLKFKCRRWSRTQGATWGESNIDAEFQQWFGP